MTSTSWSSRRSLAVAFLAAASVAGLAGCSSSGGSTGATSGGDTSASCKTGTEAPYANPAGTPLTLPAGITVEGDISSDVDAHCANKTPVEDASDLDFACLGLRNATGANITVTVPAGLTFVAKNAATQNGIVIHSHDLEAVANKVTYFYFRLGSLNRACDPTSTTDVYTLGNVTNDPKLVEILTLAKTKKVDGDTGAEIVGRMIWDVTDGTGVTDEHRMQLAAAPDL